LKVCGVEESLIAGEQFGLLRHRPAIGSIALQLGQSVFHVQRYGTVTVWILIDRDAICLTAKGRDWNADDCVCRREENEIDKYRATLRNIVSAWSEPFL
jgi:hypothetical protein